MGKATGFMDYSRTLPVLRAAVERVRDWSEFHGHHDEATLREQGSRCMDCGVPFCHTGTLINGAASGCPINNLIPEWNHLVYTGNWRAALDVLHKTNNFPEFTGRVCPAPCEGSCVLGIGDEPVTIKSIECAIVDRGFEEGWIVPEPPLVRTGKRVAIVGSGPAGLACADQLNKSGHWVTVFEKADRIGGLLLYGIPNMKLDKSIVQRRVTLLAAEGIEFVTNTEVGKDYETSKLVHDFDAVVLCGGAAKPRDLLIPGRELKGIHFAMDFLTANTKRLLDSHDSVSEFSSAHRFGTDLSATGKDVIVIGGGDTGTDCIATALRQGCRSLVQFEIMPQPGPVRTFDNPWPQWPKVHRVDYGQEEAAEIFGADPRAYSIRSEVFIGNDAGELMGVQTITVEWQKGISGSSGLNGAVNSSAANTALTIAPVPNSEHTWPAQLVLLAMGFAGPSLSGPIADLHLSLTTRGTLAVNENKMTTHPGIFAAGDIERGQSLVVWAIFDGRHAAVCVDQHLR
ncbi:MAG TPA: glutamate synthase subunit beta [Pyrinomonadaceae bacterium]